MPFENTALSLICRLCLVTPSGDNKGSGQLKHRPAPRTAFPMAPMHPWAVPFSVGGREGTGKKVLPICPLCPSLHLIKLSVAASFL